MGDTPSPMAGIFSFLYGFQQAFQLGKALNLIIGSNVLRVGFAGGIDPAGTHTHLLAAQNIRCQAVAYDHGSLYVKIGNLCKAPLKIYRIRLVGTNLLGNEDPLKKVRNISALQPSCLHVGGAVAG